MFKALMGGGKPASTSDARSSGSSKGSSRRKTDSKSSRKSSRGDDRDRGLGDLSAYEPSAAGDSVASTYVTAEPESIDTSDPTIIHRAPKRRDSDRDSKSSHRRERDRSASREREKRKSRRATEDSAKGDYDDDRDDKRDRRERRRTKSGDSYGPPTSMPSSAPSAQFAADIAAPGFSQFPMQYDNGMPSSPGHGSSPAPYDPHVQQQFPGQFPSTVAEPYLSNPAGAAADYYGDQGQSVAEQPGVRPTRPAVIPNSQAHLQSASSSANPPPEPSSVGGVGAAAAYYSAEVDGSDSQAQPQPTPSSSKPPKTSKPSRPSRPSKPSKPSSSSAIAAGAAGVAAYGVGTEMLSQHETGSSSMTSVQQQQTHSYSQPAMTSTSKPPHGHSQSIGSGIGPGIGLAAAGAAAGYMMGHHNHSSSPAHSSQYTYQNYEGSSQGGTPYGPPGPSGPSGGYPYGAGSLGFQQRQRGPLGRLVDFWRDPYGVGRFEDYTQTIGVCKYCFDPGTSSLDAPRKHHYHHHRRHSADRYSSGSSSRVNKLSRYQSSEDESRRRKKSKKSSSSWLPEMFAGYAAKSLFTGKDFEDSYSVRPNRASDDRRASYHGERHSNDSYTSRGVVRRSARSPARDYHSDIKRTTYAERSRRTRSRSRSSSRSGHHSYVKEAALGAAVGSAALAVAKSRQRNRSQSPGRSSGRKESSSDSSFLDVSRKSVGGGIGSFFTASSENRKTRRTKKRRGFFSFNGSSSSSLDDDLAFGSGFAKKSKSPKSKKKGKKNEDVDAALLGLGATATALAASSHGRSKSTGQILAAKEHRSRHSASSATIEDDEWIDAESEDQSSSDVSSNLAFGGSSAESGSDSSGGWGWRWGSKKKKKESKSSAADAALAIGAGALGSAALASVARKKDSKASSSTGSLQQVYPVPTSDPSRFDVAKMSPSVMSGGDQTPLVRPGPIPLQQPQPMTPVSQALYTTQGSLPGTIPAYSAPPVFPIFANDDDRYDTTFQHPRDDAEIPPDVPYIEREPVGPLRRSDSSPVIPTQQSSTSKLKRRSTTRDQASVSFDLTEEQVEKERRRRGKKNRDELEDESEELVDRGNELPRRETDRRSHPRKDRESDSSSWIEAAAVVATGAVAASTIYSHKTDDAEASEASQRRIDERREKRRAERRRVSDSEPEVSVVSKPDVSEETSPTSEYKEERKKRSPRPAPVHEDYAEFFAPEEVRHSSDNNSRDASSGGMPMIVEIEPAADRFEREALEASREPYEGRDQLPWPVPRLNIIEPTPPHSVSGSVRDASSPTVEPVDKSYDNKQREHQTKEYDTPSSSEQYSLEQEAASPKSTSKDVNTKPDYGDDIEFAAAVAAATEAAGFDPSMVTDNPTYHTRTSPPGSEDEGAFTTSKPEQAESREIEQPNGKHAKSSDDDVFFMPGGFDVDDSQDIPREDSRSVYSAPAGEPETPTKSKKSRRSGEVADLTRDTASPPPVDENDGGNKKKKKKKRRSKRDSGLDDATSIASSPARIEESGEKSHRKKRSSRRSDGDGLYDDSDKDMGTKDDVDLDDYRSERQREKDRRRGYEKGMESGDRQDFEKDEKSFDYNDADIDKKPFLGQGPEMPAATERDESGASGLQETMEVAAMVAAGLGLGETALKHLPQDRPVSPAAENAARDLASQSHSSPATPELAQEQDFSPMPRRLSMARSSTESPTAVPLHFRRPLSSPKLQRVVPTDSPTAVSPSSPNQPRHRRLNSTEFRNSREYRPLWLVERHGSAKAELEQEEPLPSLPSSKSSSRAPSVEDLRSLNEQDYVRSWEPVELGQSIMDRRRLSGLAISTDTANQAPDAVDPDLLDSQQTTPTALSFGEAAAALSAKKDKPKYEFHSPSELLQDPSVVDELPPSPTLEALPSAEGSMVGYDTRDLAESEENRAGHKSLPGTDLGKAAGFGGLVDAAVLAAVKGHEKPVSPSHDKEITESAALPKEPSPQARKIHGFGNIVDAAVMSKAARHDQKPTDELLDEPETAIEEPMLTERELEHAPTAFAETATDEVATMQSSKKKKKKKGKKNQASQSVDWTPSESVPVAEEQAPVVEEAVPESWEVETQPALADDKEETLALQPEAEPTDTSRDLDYFPLESVPTETAEPFPVAELETAPEPSLTTPVDPVEQPEDTAGLSKKAKREKKKQKKKGKSISLAEHSEDAPVSQEGEELQQEKGMEISPEGSRDEIVSEPVAHAAQDSIPSDEPAMFETVMPEPREVDYARAAFVEADSTPEPEQQPDDTIFAPSLDDNTAPTDKGDIETEEDDFHEAFEEQPFSIAKTRELAPEASTDASMETPTEPQEPLAEEAWEIQPKKKGRKDKKKRKSVTFEDTDIPSEPTLAPETEPESTMKEPKLEKSSPAKPVEPSSTGGDEVFADIDPTVTDIMATSETAADEPPAVSEPDSADRTVVEEGVPSTEPAQRSDEASRDGFEQPAAHEQPEAEAEAEVVAAAPMTAAQKKKAKKEKQKKKNQQSVSSIPDEDKPAETQPAEQLAEDITSTAPDAEAEPTDSSRDIPSMAGDVSVEAPLEEAKNEESLEPEQPKEDDTPSSIIPEFAGEVAEAEISSEQPQEPPTASAEYEDPPAEPEVFMTASQKKKAKKAKKKQQQQQQSIGSITDNEKPDEAVSGPDTEATDISKLPSTVDPEAEVPDPEFAEYPETSEDAAPATEIETPTTTDERAAETVVAPTSDEIAISAEVSPEEEQDQPFVEADQQKDEEPLNTGIPTTDASTAPAEPEPVQEEPEAPPPEPAAPLTAAQKKKAKKEKKKQQQQKWQSTELDEQAAPEHEPSSTEDNNAEVEPTASTEAQLSLLDEATATEEMATTDSKPVETDRELDLNEQSQDIINSAEEATPEVPVEESAVDLSGTSEQDYPLASTETDHEDPAGDTPTTKESTLESSAEVMAPNDKPISDQPAEEVATAPSEPSDIAVPEQIEESQPVSSAKSKKQKKKDKKKRQSLSLDDEPHPAPVEEEKPAEPASSEIITEEPSYIDKDESLAEPEDANHQEEIVTSPQEAQQPEEPSNETDTLQDTTPEEPAAELEEVDFQPAVSKKQRKKDKKKRKSVAWDDEAIAAQFEQPLPEQYPSAAVESAQSEEAKAVEELSDQQTEATSAESTEATELVADKDVAKEVEPTLQEQEDETDEAPQKFTELTETAEILRDVTSSEEPLQLATSPATEPDTTASTDASKEMEAIEVENAPRVPTESDEQPEDIFDSLTSPDQKSQTPDEAESQAASAIEPKEEVALSAKERRKLKKKGKKGKSVDLSAEEPAYPEPTQEEQEILETQEDSLKTAEPESVEATDLEAPAADNAKALDIEADAEAEALAEKTIGDEQPVVQEDTQPEQLETTEIDTDGVADNETAQPEPEAVETPETSETTETDVGPPSGETVAEPEPSSSNEVEESAPQITTEREEEVGMSAKERRKAKKKDKKRRSKILDADDTASNAPTDEPTQEQFLTESIPADNVTQDATEISPLAETDTMETSTPVTAPMPAETDDGKEQSRDIDTDDAPANDLASTDEFVISQEERPQPEGLSSDYYTQSVLERGVESGEAEKDFVQEEGVESLVPEQEASAKTTENSQDFETEREGVEDKEDVQDPVLEKETETRMAEPSAAVETIDANDPIEQNDELSAQPTDEQFAEVNVKEAPSPAEEEAWQSTSSKKQKKKEKKKKQKQQVQIEEEAPAPELEISATSDKDQSEMPPSTDTEAEQTVPEAESEPTLEETPAEQTKDLTDEPASRLSEAEANIETTTFETPGVDNEGFTVASLSRKMSKKEKKKQLQALLAQEADTELQTKEQPVAETPEASVPDSEVAESQPTADETLEDQPVIGPADVTAETAEDGLKDVDDQLGDIVEQEPAENAVVLDGSVDTPFAERHADEAEESPFLITPNTAADVPPAETAAMEQTSNEPVVEPEEEWPEEEWPAFTSKKSKKNKKKAAAAAAAAAATAMAVEFATQDDKPVESTEEPTTVSGPPAGLEQEQFSKDPAEPQPESVSKKLEDLAALSPGEAHEEATTNLEAREQEVPEQDPAPEEPSEDTVPVELPTRKLSKKEKQKAKKQAKWKTTDFTAFTEDPSDLPEPEPSETAFAPTEYIEEPAQEPAPGVERITTETSTEDIPEPEPERLEDNSASTVEESTVIPDETQQQDTEEDQTFVSLDPFDAPPSPQAEDQDRAFDIPEQGAIENTQDLQFTPEQQYEKDEEAEARQQRQALEKAADLEVAEDMFEDRPREPEVHAAPSRKLSKKEKKKLKKKGVTEDTPAQEYEEPPADAPAELETTIPSPEPQAEQLQSTDDAQPQARPESAMNLVDSEPTATFTEPVQDEWEVPVSRKASKKQAKKAKKAAQAFEWEPPADTGVSEPTTTVPAEEETMIAQEMEAAEETRADEDDWPTIEWEKGNVERSAQSPDQAPESEPVTLARDTEMIGEFDEAAVPTAVKETEEAPEDGFMAEAWSMPLSKKDKKKAKKSKRKSQQQEAFEEEPEQTVAEFIPEPASEPTTSKHIELEAPARSTAAKGSKLANLFLGLERGGFRRPFLGTQSGSPTDDTPGETAADLECSRDISMPTLETSIATSESKDNIDIPSDELSSSGERGLEFTESTTPTKQPTTATEEDSPTDPDLPAFARSLAASSPPPAPQSATKERSSLLFSSSPSTRTEVDSASPRHSLPSQAHLAANDSHGGIRRTPSVIHGRHQHTPRTWGLEEAALQAERNPSPPRSLFGGPIDGERPRTPLDPIAEQDPADGGHATTGTRGTPRLKIKPEHVLPRPQTPVRQFTDTAHGRERWPTPEHEKKQKHKSPELQHAPELRPSSSDRSLRHSRSNGASRALDSQPPPDLDPDALPSSSSYDPVNDKGKRPLRTMTDVYEGWGETPSSPRSPSRPPSVHRRRSMQQLQTLESRLDQLISENRLLIAARDEAEDRLRNASVARRKSDQALNTRGADLRDKEAEVEQLKNSVDWLQREMSRLTQENEGLTASNAALAAAHAAEVNTVRESSTRELDDLRSQHNDLSSQVDDRVRQEIKSALAQKETELRRLHEELEEARDKVKELQQQIAASLHDNALVFRDEDYFDAACQKLCGHVQQWVLRFSKHSDQRRCRTLAELNDEKIADRFDNALLDGSDADAYLSDRVRRRDIFMSVIMTMVWEYVFTRYLFGMDREQRQKLKSLEKQLVEVGPRRAVHRWRATTLTLLSRRPAFESQRENDTEAVVLEIFGTLARVLPPPSHAEPQLLDSLRKVLQVAVNLSLEMRTQLAEFIMLPPLQPEYDTNGDLARQVYFNASLMNERSGQTTSNEDLESQQAVVRIVLFPLVVKKGNDVGEGDDEVVVCPAQVLVARPGKDKKVARMFSGDRMSMDASKSVYSVAPSVMDTSNMI